MSRLDNDIRVVVADEQALCREGIALILDRQQGITVVAEVGGQAAAASMARTHRAHVLLLGLDLTNDDLESAIHMVKVKSPGTKIVVLSSHDDPLLVRGAFGSGATGYVTRNSSGAELVAAVQAVQRDDRHAVVAMSREGLTRYADGSPSPVTAREAEILKLAAEALTNSQIAARLNISESTVKRHLTNAYARLGAESRIDAINKAAALGIVRKP